ncbi:MAG: hypothetical protein JWO77_403 [Ilumatobacteraceae bacterium]|nr:hypothetical protein [Ilumatobacteraceae bacterium]
MYFARSLWLRNETLHAVTYFGEETLAAGSELGLGGFWMGYFGFRAAPLGAVEPGVVEAAFSNFAPTFVRRWVPDVWTVAEPTTLVVQRSSAAAATLRRAAPGIEATAAAAAPFLDAAIAAGVAAGRPLFAANRDLALPDDPVEALWQRCTTIREHRGDGHVAALAAAGVDGIEAHVLIALDQGSDPLDLQRTRGWTESDWAAAVDRLRHRNLVDGDGRLTSDGRDLRASVEHTTDHLAARPWQHLDEVERTRLVELLDPAATAVSGAGILRYPNPMGLPPLP